MEILTFIVDHKEKIDNSLNSVMDVVRVLVFSQIYFGLVFRQTNQNKTRIRVLPRRAET